MTQKKKLSIKDIAARLNTSVTTVSFVINGKAKEMRISENLETEILDFIKKNNYKPNRLAQSMRTGKSNTIALLVEDISNPFFASVARVIEDQAYARGYKIIYCSTENNTEKTRDLLKMLLDFQVDGFIITPPIGVESEIMALINKDLPVVLFDRYYPDLSVDHVVIDNRSGAFQAVEHLAAEGFSNIAMVTIISEQTQMNDRRQGYELAIKKRCYKNYMLQIPEHTSSEDCSRVIQGFLKQNPEIDSVFFSTNYLALAGIDALDKGGKMISSDIGVVAFDDQDLFKIHKPSITAVMQPIAEMSLRVMNTLLNRLKDIHKPVEKLTLSPKLIIRNSSLKIEKKIDGILPVQ